MTTNKVMSVVRSLVSTKKKKGCIFSAKSNNITRPHANGEIALFGLNILPTRHKGETGLKKK